MFKNGDIVQLKSGGPMMTVAFINCYGIYCRWFDIDKKLEEAYFESEVLSQTCNNKICCMILGE